MTESSPKIQRWIDLVAWLLAHRSPLTFAEIERGVPGYLGKAKGTQKRMFERDKKELKALGIPIQTIGDEGDEESSYKLSSKDFYLPYLAVTTARGTSKPRRVDRYGYHSLATLTFEPDELHALEEAASRARRLGDPALAADAEHAMRKLAFDLPMGAVAPRDDTRVLGPARAHPNAKILERLGAALLARKRVEIDYFGMSSDAASRRTVEPYGLFFLNAHWYLAARDVEHDGVRNYRVNRVSTAKVNSAREGTPDYEIPESFDLREHARSKQAWELGEGEVVEAIVEFRAESGAARAAAALGNVIPRSEATRDLLLAEGVSSRSLASLGTTTSRSLALLGTTGAALGMTRAFTVRRVDVFARWLLSFAGEAVPLSPPRVVEEFRRLVTATRAVYE